MNLREYFRQIREIEASLETAEVVVKSLKTADGGRAGIFTEVPRSLAAQMIVEGRAIQASSSECSSFIEQQETERLAARKAEVARKLQVTVVAGEHTAESRELNAGNLSRK